jgi:hypothetical protein
MLLSISAFNFNLRRYNEVLTTQEVRAMTHARVRNPETRSAAARMYGDGLTRGFSAAYGQRGAEVVSPWWDGAA